MLGMSYLGIFRPLSATVQVPSRAPYGADGFYTAWDLVYGAISTQVTYT